VPVGGSVQAVVFDPFFTLVHPGTYPGGGGRLGWLARILGVDRDALRARWKAFEPVLESGGALGDTQGLGPELSWVAAVAAEFGVGLDAAAWALIEADWDRTRRMALLDPPPPTLAMLATLRSRGVRVGVLSNTHALETRAWPRPRWPLPWTRWRCPTRSASASRTAAPTSTFCTPWECPHLRRST